MGGIWESLCNAGPLERNQGSWSVGCPGDVVWGIGHAGRFGRDERRNDLNNGVSCIMEFLSRHTVGSTVRRLALVSLVLLGGAVAAPAGMIRIKITNQQPAGGFALTPVWVGLHDGGFDLFDPGEAVSTDMERLAELGDVSGIVSAFAGRGPAGVVFGNDPVPPFLPGNMTTLDLDVTDPAVQRFFSFATMVVPSNDLFLANPNAQGIELFSSSGVFLGDRTISLFGGMVWDAGTEVNDITNGAAFVAGLDATGGTSEGGVAHLLFDDPTADAYLNSILGTVTPAGMITSRFGRDSLLATIQITAVPEPGSMALLASGAVGFGLIGLRRRMRRQRTGQ